MGVRLLTLIPLGNYLVGRFIKRHYRNHLYMEDRTLYEQLIDLFRLHQQKSMFIASAYGSELSITESFILVELDVESSRSAGFIASLLNVDKSTLSKSVKRLVKAGYLRSEKKKDDRRKRALTLTAKARDFLKRHDQFNSSQLAELTSNLSVSELSELQSYLKTLADSCGAMQAPLRESENPLLNEMRRLSRVFGLFGSSLIGTAYSAVEWQTLSELRYGGPPLRAKDLCRRLAVPANTMSQLITRFEKAGLVARGNDAADGRNRPLALTPRGVAAVEGIEQAACELLKEGLRLLSEAEISRFVQVFRAYLGIAVEDGALVLQSELRLVRLAEAQVSEARAFLVFHLVRLNAHLQLPEILIGKDSISFGIFEGRHLAALYEFSYQEDALALSNYVHSGKFDGGPLVSWLKAVLTQLRNTGAEKVICPPHNPATRLAAQLEGSTRRSDGWVEISLG